MSGYDLLDLITADPLPNKQATRDAVLAAITKVAAEHDGLVTAAWVRPLLPEYANPHQVGATISVLVKQGVLTRTGATHTSGNQKQRNTYRPMPVYRLESAA